MAKFDFINGEDFRLSLESDYEELSSSMQARAWKAVHVLSGSIIEAILIDYLLAAGYQKRSSFDPLKMTLAQAISACRQENVLSEKTEHLSHVIRSYRNLIHPGRSVRLSEIANENGAKIAQALIEIIVEEIEASKKQNYGYTAEQIITKIEGDSTSIAILGHLLNDTKEIEKERLLLYLIPKRYSHLIEQKNDPQNVLEALTACYRLAFDTVSEETKKKAAKNFARIIKEESSNVQWRYIFFKGKDLQYFSPEDCSLVKDHFLSILTHPLIDSDLSTIEGIGKYLARSDMGKFVIPYINTITLYDLNNTEQVRKSLIGEYFSMDINARKELANNIQLIFNKYNKDRRYNKFIKALTSEVITLIDEEDPLADLEDQPF